MAKRRYHESEFVRTFGKYRHPLQLYEEDMIGLPDAAEFLDEELQRSRARNYRYRSMLRKLGVKVR